MDSEDSRDDTSASDSNDGGPQSPESVKSHDIQSDKSPSRSRSRTRSSTPSSRSNSGASRHSDSSVDKENNAKSPGSPSDRSRSSSADNIVRSRKSSKEVSPPESPDPEERINSPHSPGASQSPDHSKSLIRTSPVHLPNNRRSPNNSQETPESPTRQESPESPSHQETPESPSHTNASQDLANHQRDTPASPTNQDTPESPVNKHDSPDSPPHTQYPQSPSSHRSATPDSPVHRPKTPPQLDRDYRSSRSSSPASPDRVKSASRSPHRKRSHSRNDSVKSYSSTESRKSRVRSRHSSIKSRSSRSGTSDSSSSSGSSVDSTRKRKPPPNKNMDTQAEEISDGDIELDQEKDQVADTKPPAKQELNISHEDLSDVSDLEDSMGDNSEDERSSKKDKLDYKKERDRDSEEKTNTHDIKKMMETNNRAEEAEEQLDFEAEDGECEADATSKDKEDGEEKETNDNKEAELKKKEEKIKEELEEGEVTDEDDVRPEETEPRPVCRFFSRGQCTWGASCRFLHPGVTDKGNYTMFDLIRPVVAGEYGRDERMYAKVADPPLVETAWERGLRTAKEMLRKSSKRKEQDIDFEEKKMNLTLAQEEFDKENGYYGRVASPEPRYVRHVAAVEYPPVARAPPVDDYYPRRPVVYEPDYAHPVPRERVRSYRELPSHRMPDYYDDKYGAVDDHSGKKPRPASKREVIVQRLPEERDGKERERPQGRGDEWQDPWMRVRSPAGTGSNRRRGRGRKRSYSSGSSYSSSSSSRSSSDTSRSSNYRSRSVTPRHTRRRSRSRRSRHVSPSVIVSERKAANERAALMNPPAPKRRAPSPGMMRVSGAANPPAPSREDRRRSKLAVAAALARVKGVGRKPSRSSSGSSGSSSSDSDSSDSSSSSSHGGSSPSRRPPGVDLSLVKAMDALKGGGLEKKQIKLNLKNPVSAIKKDIAEFARKTEAAASQAKKRPAGSPPLGDPKSKKATSRREELLKQLKAVEDAIAKKRSKVN